MNIYDNMTPSILYHDLIESIVAALEVRDRYTANHSRRVSDMTENTCIALGMEIEEYEPIHMAAHVHDIGKIGISDFILLKPGRLSCHEWEQIKKHSQIGADILSKSLTLKSLSKIVLHHHERWDGKGYPEGLKGEKIPWGSRVIAICDSIDAMMSSRIYRKRITAEQCKEEIYKCSGQMYDPKIAKFILKHWENIVSPVYTLKA
ncbi:MAG: HD-GYP domain-containing protein [Aminipila sp.]